MGEVARTKFPMANPRPNTEYRNPKSEGNSKPEFGKTAGDFGRGMRFRLTAIPAAKGAVRPFPSEANPFTASSSVFGIRISFGFRNSDFGLWTARALPLELPVFGP
jgi:hypothetical protein